MLGLGIRAGVARLVPRAALPRALAHALQYAERMSPPGSTQERKRHDAHAWGAIAVLGAGIVAEGLRLATNRPWPGFRAMWSHAASALLIAIFAATLFSLLRRHRSRPSASASWFLAIAAPIAMAAHASVTRVGGSTVGLLYYAGAAILVFTLKRTFDRGERHRLPDEPQGRRLPQGSAPR